MSPRIQFRNMYSLGHLASNARCTSTGLVHVATTLSVCLLMASVTLAQNSGFEPTSPTPPPITQLESNTPLKIGEIPSSAFQSKHDQAPATLPVQTDQNVLLPVSPNAVPARTTGFRRELGARVQESANALNSTPLSKPAQISEAPRLPDSSPDRPYYQLDPSHTSLVFAIGHGNFSFVYGRFNNCWGRFVLDQSDPTRSSFNFTIETASVDTNDDERDKHLRGPDFFDVQQHNKITFRSTSIEFKDGTYTATGDMTMLGQTKEITIPFQLLGRGKGIFGKERAGFFAKFRLKRSDFGMTKMLSSGVGNNISVTFSFEGISESDMKKDGTRTATDQAPATPISNK